MTLGPVSYLDCVAFCLFLVPQLIWQAGLWETVVCVLRALPFLVFKLPVTFLYERWLIKPERRAPFVQRSSAFEDIVVRCVRYAFANIPPRVGRVFFSRSVALPFLRFRLLRQGYLTLPAHYREITATKLKGVWLVKAPEKRLDFVLYYVHGGGFSLGSPYFYLEFLLTWLSLLGDVGYDNPGIFALDYTLVPDASFPTQLHETVRGYQHVLAVALDPAIICVGGDSAGAALVLSMLLYLARHNSSCGDGAGQVRRIPKPALAVLISPWVTLVSERHRNSTSDYLDVDALRKYGLQFAGSKRLGNNPLASPGNCKDVAWWRNAAPTKGILITYGQEEVIAPEIKDLVGILQKMGLDLDAEEEPAGIHAWPIASLFLSSSTEQRYKGVRRLVDKVREKIIAHSSK
ncbi:hypothetical protein VTK73DRAFT_9760 [Phialemonium thermophilum]|uniref:Alpha/beta hydrolase fold-3 domain-containing protein n=1 Tax=Phialemonium thermophilum TaxID=223376 RepID=A0ABR3XIX1_9PEZI